MSELAPPVLTHYASYLRLTTSVCETTDLSDEQLTRSDDHVTCPECLDWIAETDSASPWQPAATPRKRGSA
jgi:hypothetical protein